jgi:uncharacterized membrane protein YphA (DoxX/SURF4 family)
MQIVARIAQFLLGIAFLAFGLNGFLHFLPSTLPQEDTAKAFLDVLVSTKYLLVVKVLEIIAGLLILSGRLAPLGLLILCPILVNIALYDLLMNPEGLAIALPLCVLAGFLLYHHREHFAPFFVVRHDHCTFMPTQDTDAA